MAKESRTLRPEIRARFRRAVSTDDDRIDLGLAALLIAHEEYSELNVAGYRARIAGLAARARVAPKAPLRRRVDAINRVLFEEEGLRGNERDYYDPRNSFLNDVLDRKLGIPISLSVIFLEVARRVGVTAWGIGLPGHFIVGAADDESLLLDPFNAGRVLDYDGCAELLARVYGHRFTFRPELLAPLSRRQILTRMLMNLKAIYLNASEYGRALAIVDRLLIVNPSAFGELRDRGVICQRLHFLGQAIADFSHYLQLAPTAADADAVHQVLENLRREALTPN